MAFQLASDPLMGRESGFVQMRLAKTFIADHGERERPVIRNRHTGSVVFDLAVAGIITGLFSCLAPAYAQEEALTVKVISGRPDMVTGGDALLQISVLPSISIADVRVSVNGIDVTRVFRAGETRNQRFGVIEDLVLGENEVNVSSVSKTAFPQALTLVNYPAQGPVFSGPHERPFICETDDFELFSGETLGVPNDEDCSIDRRVDYVYRAVGESMLKPLSDPFSIPDDIDTTITLSGVEVPYMVRIETGTINRAIYQISMLHEFSPDFPAPDVWRSSLGWNGRLIYSFGGGCVNGWYRQGSRTGGVTDEVMLSQGFAVASSTLNVYGNNCNDVLAAETMMMVKERFIEAYGQPRYTIGWGCSGGSYQNHQIADNYPGLLDGIVPGCSFPDVGSGTIPMVTDARLLNRYFDEGSTVSFTDTQKSAVVGFVNLATMPNVSVNAGRINVTEFCPDVLPMTMRYDPVDNVQGARCDVFSHYVNIYGRDQETGFARRILDNVGVQYGLAALNGTVISPEQFLDVNRYVGGYDEDGKFRSNRTEGDAVAIGRAYRTGRLTSGGGGLAETPVIDYRAYSDDRENGDVHVRYHSFSMRERLMKANGHANNHVMLVEDDRYGLYSSSSPVLRGALAHMDQWLSNLSADMTNAPKSEKVVRSKPVELVDACWSRSRNPERIVEEQVRGSGRCEELYPSAPGPREVAGAPVTGDILKCQLKQIDIADYAVSFTAEEEAELRDIFTDGVCDWTKPGRGQTGLANIWQSFSEN